MQHNQGEITYCCVKGLVKNRNERMIVTAFLHVVTEIEEKKYNVLPYNRGFYMSAHVLLNLLNQLTKEIKCEACRAFNLFFSMSLINSIIQEHKC